MPFWGFVLGAAIIFMGDLYVVIAYMIDYFKYILRIKKLRKSIDAMDLVGIVKERSTLDY
jgi:hypothetical protein